MSDVVFITPNMTADTRAESIGTLQLATILMQAGISCEILQYFRIGDVTQFADFLDNAVRLIEEKKPKILSFYSRCDTYHISLRIAECVKAKQKDICIVFGGPQSDITAEATLRQIPWVDYICCGEGETTVVPLFSSILQGKPELATPGLVYRLDGEIVKNPRPVLIEDLDSLPMLDYTLLHFNESKEALQKPFDIDVGRGCPFACTFCSTNSFWGRNFRLKSPQRIYEEVKYLHEHYGRTRFSFSHDMFTFNRKKVRETCALLKTLDFPIEWGCSARVDCLDKELIDTMADAGMVGVYLGIETGSPRMQKLINKNLKVQNVVELVAYLKEKGIETVASFIYGFPEETEEDVSLTIGLIGKLLNLRCVRIQTHLCTFHVGTELSRRYRDEMTPVTQYSDQTGEYAIAECADLIQGHPEIFQHMMEYKTELRSKLNYLPTFIGYWKRMLPVYRHISEKYPENRLIDMYYDFVAANGQILDTYQKKTDGNIYEWLLEKDRFPDQFAGDEYYDMIQDYCRYRKLCISQDIRNGENLSDVFFFDPNEIETKPLRECRRCMTMLTWHDGKRYMTIESAG